MAIRVLLTPLFHSPEDRRALDTAFVLAHRFQGHVDALLAQPDPMDTIPIVGEGALPSRLGACDNAPVRIAFR